MRDNEKKIKIENKCIIHGLDPCKTQKKI